MVSSQPVKVFESHTKLDADFCDVFDRACARVGIDAFRSEYENIQPPAWQTIRNELGQSKALFLLVGKALINEQSVHNTEWEYTQNWIAYEIGVASELQIDIWVVCDRAKINFPVPYFNNYFPYSIRSKHNFQSLVTILQNYRDGARYNLMPKYQFTCPNEECALSYNLIAKVDKEDKITCPCCLHRIVFHGGWPKELKLTSKTSE